MKEYYNIKNCRKVYLDKLIFGEPKHKIIHNIHVAIKILKGIKFKQKKII